MSEDGLEVEELEVGSAAWLESTVGAEGWLETLSEMSVADLSVTADEALAILEAYQDRIEAEYIETRDGLSDDLDDLSRGYDRAIGQNDSRSAAIDRRSEKPEAQNAETQAAFTDHLSSLAEEKIDLEEDYDLARDVFGSAEAILDASHANDLAGIEAARAAIAAGEFDPEVIAELAAANAEIAEQGVAIGEIIDVYPDLVDALNEIHDDFQRTSDRFNSDRHEIINRIKAAQKDIARPDGDTEEEIAEYIREREEFIETQVGDIERLHETYNLAVAEMVEARSELLEEFDANTPAIPVLEVEEEAPEPEPEPEPEIEDEEVLEEDAGLNLGGGEVQLASAEGSWLDTADELLTGTMELVTAGFRDAYQTVASADYSMEDLAGSLGNYGAFAQQADLKGFDVDELIAMATGGDDAGLDSRDLNTQFTV